MFENGPEWIFPASLVVRFAHELGCNEAINKLIPLFRSRLLTHLTHEGVIPAWPGGPPSLLWTSWAADLCMTLHIEIPSHYNHPIDSLPKLIEDHLAMPVKRNPICLGWWRRQIADGLEVLLRHRPNTEVKHWAAAIIDGVVLDEGACKGLWMLELLDLSRMAEDLEIEKAIIMRNHARA